MPTETVYIHFTVDKAAAKAVSDAAEQVLQDLIAVLERRSKVIIEAAGTVIGDPDEY